MNTPEPTWSSAVPGTAAGPVVSNPFDSDPVARRYAHVRPYYHRSALGLATRQLGISHARLAVDVACGTGLSTRAVLELADRVVAIDTSHAMLRAAQPQPRARYLVAAAERIPLRDAAADLAPPSAPPSTGSTSHAPSPNLHGFSAAAPAWPSTLGLPGAGGR